jgi:hypothetical protein
MPEPKRKLPKYPKDAPFKIVEPKIVEPKIVEPKFTKPKRRKPRKMLGSMVKAKPKATGMSPRGQKDPTRRPKAKTYKEYHSERYRRSSETGALPKDKLQPPGPPSQKKIRKSVIAGMAGTLNKKRK